jgi:hypothetical protein
MRFKLDMAWFDSLLNKVSDEFNTNGLVLVTNFVQPAWHSNNYVSLIWVDG